MSNNLHPDIVHEADRLFSQEELSIREVCRRLKIAKETATRIYKYSKVCDIEYGYDTIVCKGKRKDGTITKRRTKKIREHWRNSHHLKKGTVPNYQPSHKNNLPYPNVLQ